MRAVKSLSSTTTHQRKAVDGVRDSARAGRTARSLRPPRAPAASPAVPRRPARRAGRRADRGIRPATAGRRATSAGSVRRGASRRRRSRPSSLRSARCRSSPACRSWCASGNADRAASRRAASMCRKNAGMSWMSSCGSSSRAAINRYLASDSWPWPRIALACVSSSCGWRSASYGVYRSLPMASSSGWTPAASTAWTAWTPGITWGITGPVSSWISSPKTVSSCGGRPTTVNGQIASVAMIDVLDAQDREIVRQAVVAQMIAERPFGQLLVRVDRAR